MCPFFVSVASLKSNFVGLILPLGLPIAKFLSLKFKLIGLTQCGPFRIVLVIRSNRRSNLSIWRSYRQVNGPDGE
jgi:hypothetical protein